MIKVFLADDHAVLRDGLRSILDAQNDMTVVGDAADGRAAVRQVRQLSPDVVVMDISMPNLNGIEATQRIREDYPATEVVILSIHATSEHIFRALQAGARGYVLKESAGQEVVKAVRTVHAGHRYLSNKIADTVVEDYIHESHTPQAKSPLERLSQREREVLQYIARGHSKKEIAGIMTVSVKTVDNHAFHLMNKLGIHNRVELARFAIREGLASV